MLQNVANMAKASLDAGLIKADARGKADLWSQVAAVEDFCQELRTAQAAQAQAQASAVNIVAVAVPAPAPSEPPV